MMNVLIAAGLGLCLGTVIGFALGTESRWRCRECLAATGSRYQAGYKEGFRSGVEAAVELVKVRMEPVEIRNGVGWAIREKKLEQLQEDWLRRRMCKKELSLRGRSPWQSRGSCGVFYWSWTEDRRDRHTSLRTGSR